MGIAILCAFYSCKSEQEKQKQKLETAIRQRLEDYAFKHNDSIKIFKIDSIKYKMIGQSEIDSNLLFKYNNKFFEFSDESKRYGKLANTQLQQVQLMRELGSSSTILDSYRKDAEESIDKMKEMRDSMNFYNQKSEAIERGLKGRKENKKIFYATHFFCKATVGRENIMDTLYMVFDSNYRYVNM